MVALKRGEESGPSDIHMHTGRTSCEDDGRDQGNLYQTRNTKDCQRTTRSQEVNIEQILFYRPEPC